MGEFASKVLERAWKRFQRRDPDQIRAVFLDRANPPVPWMRFQSKEAREVAHTITASLGLGSAKAAAKCVCSEVVQANLIHAYRDHPRRPIRIPRSGRDSRLRDGIARYNRVRVGAPMLNRIVDVLVQKQYVEIAMGFYNRQRCEGRQTRIWPTGRLLDLFEHFDEPVLEIPPDLVVLRDAD